MTDETRIALRLAERELNRARSLHAPMNSAHEGLAVLLEELDELKAEVWKREHDTTALEKEATQLAAMALRFLIDVCDVASVTHDFDTETATAGQPADQSVLDLLCTVGALEEVERAQALVAFGQDALGVPFVVIVTATGDPAEPFHVKHGLAFEPTWEAVKEEASPLRKADGEKNARATLRGQAQALFNALGDGPGDDPIAVEHRFYRRPLAPGMPDLNNPTARQAFADALLDQARARRARGSGAEIVDDDQGATRSYPPPERRIGDDVHDGFGHYLDRSGEHPTWRPDRRKS